MKNIKPEPIKIKSTDPLEESQRILANIIASAHLHKANREGHNVKA